MITRSGNHHSHLNGAVVSNHSRIDGSSTFSQRVAKRHIVSIDSEGDIQDIVFVSRHIHGGGIVGIGGGQGHLLHIGNAVREDAGFDVPSLFSLHFVGVGLTAVDSRVEADRTVAGVSFSHDVTDAVVSNHHDSIFGSCPSVSQGREAVDVLNIIDGEGDELVASVRSEGEVKGGVINSRGITVDVGNALANGGDVNSILIDSSVNNHVVVAMNVFHSVGVGVFLVGEDSIQNIVNEDHSQMLTFCSFHHEIPILTAVGLARGYGSGAGRVDGGGHLVNNGIEAHRDGVLINHVDKGVGITGNRVISTSGQRSTVNGNFADVVAF